MEPFLLTQWQDGYREVARLDGDVRSILRYYVVERVERHGRLALDAGGTYPDLRMLQRKPGEVSWFAVVDDLGERAFRPVLDERRREGDKVEHHYRLEPTKDSPVKNLAEAARAASAAVDADASSSDAGARLEAVRRQLGLAAASEQSEAASFVEMLVERAEGEGTR